MVSMETRLSANVHARRRNAACGLGKHDHCSLEVKVLIVSIFFSWDCQAVLIQQLKMYELKIIFHVILFQNLNIFHHVYTINK